MMKALPLILALFCATPAFAQENRETLRRRIAALEADIDALDRQLRDAERRGDRAEAKRIRKEYLEGHDELMRLRRRQDGEPEPTSRPDDPPSFNPYRERLDQPGYRPLLLSFDMDFRIYRVPTILKLGHPIDLDGRGPAIEEGLGITVRFYDTPYFLAFRGWSSSDRATHKDVEGQEFLLGMTVLNVELPQLREHDTGAFQILVGVGVSKIFAERDGPASSTGLAVMIEPRFVFDLGPRVEFTVGIVSLDFIETDFNLNSSHVVMGTWWFPMGVRVEF